MSFRIRVAQDSPPLQPARLNLITDEVPPMTHVPLKQPVTQKETHSQKAKRIWEECQERIKAINHLASVAGNHPEFKNKRLVAEIKGIGVVHSSPYVGLYHKEKMRKIAEMCVIIKQTKARHDGDLFEPTVLEKRAQILEELACIKE